MSVSRRSLARLVSALGLSGVALVAGADPLPAQFGRNEVRYEDFDFRILKTPHFDVYFYPEEEVAARDAARMAERWYARLSRILNHEFEERQPLVLYGSHPAFQQTTTLGSQPGVGTGGVTESFKQRIIMPLTGSYQETDHVLGHELVHAFQYDISGLGRSGGRISPGARAVGTAPLWFIEGMAEYLSVGPVDAHTAMWVRDAALAGDIPTVEELSTDPRIFPYRYGHALWAYIGGRWGDAAVGQILQLVGEGIPYEEAFQRLLNIEMEELSDDWQTSIRQAYLPLLATRPEAREIAQPLITQRREGGQLNLGPSVSPDGRYVAFLSELDFFDVELFVANAETGEVIRRLQKGSAFDPHFQSLRYINSAGTWSPDGRRFALSALREGRDVLVILDVESADVVQEIEPGEVSEITTPTWSPDGTTIAFAGIEGGVSDLYAYDLRTGQTRRLTRDLFANLHPSYSPDGQTLAFVTDQGAGTDLGTFEYGGYRIALLDVATGQTRIVPATGEGTGEGDAIDPEWTADGQGLYFVSNRSGIPNIYRVDLASGQLFQVTRLFGGVSGITDISPAISVSRSGDRLVFTSFENGGYNIYSLNTPQELAGTPVPAAGLAAQVAGPPPLAVLPPVPRPTEPAFNRVATILGDPRFGLPADTVYPVVPYRPRLALDYLGQPQLGISVGGGPSSRGGLYGGISGIFSDLLGYHTVFGIIQAQGQLDEIGGSVVYLYRKHRWNYGVAAQRIPYIIPLQRQFTFEPNEPGSSEGIGRLQYPRYRIFDTSVQGIAQYPFSTTRRVEFSGGLRRLAQDIQGFEITGPALVEGGRILQFLQQEQSELDGEDLDAFNLVETSAAYVYDSSLFGYTAPFAGQRYRFEVSPTFGQLQYTSALADYRRYFWFRPFTFAVRGLHFGRYGKNSEDESLLTRPVILGQPAFLRGYYYRDVFEDCRESGLNTSESCAVAGQLYGSRIAVLNAELRFPLIRSIRLGSSFGLPPIDGLIFGDAGVAWNRDTRPVFQRGLRLDETGEFTDERGLLTSAGVGARVNLFGYAILEVDYVNAFERPEGWHWVFALQPGF